MTRMTVVIDDTKWPKLRIVVSGEGLYGEKKVEVKESMYDNAYNNFEVVLHNHLAPMIKELVDRRLGTGARNR